LAQAQMETSMVLASTVTVAAAYAAQTETSGEGSVTGVSAEAALVAQTGSSGSEMSAMISSLDAVAEVNSTEIGTDVGSLVVGTASSVVGVTTADANPETEAYRANSALATYQYQLTQVLQDEAESAIPASETSAPSASDGTNDSVPGPGYLQLTVLGVIDNEPVLQAQAQQLVTAFENNMLAPTSANVTGFSYAGAFGTITGIEVPDSEVLGDMTPVTQQTAAYNSGFEDLVNESVAISGGYNPGSVDLGFAIPL
jgi:hypothetical protein